MHDSGPGMGHNLAWYAELFQVQPLAHLAKSSQLGDVEDSSKLLLGSIYLDGSMS